MRYASIAAVAALAISTPALATGGLQCRTTDRSNIQLDIVIGHGSVSAITGVQMSQGKRRWGGTAGDPLIVAQSWIDGQRLWLDLVDAQGMRYEGKLRATFNPKLKGRPALGTLVRNGRTYRIRCVEA